MSIATEITRITGARNTIRDKLVELGLAAGGAKLDALATAAFALGTDGGMALIEGIDGVEAAFIARDRTLHTTSGADAYMME